MNTKKVTVAILGTIAKIAVTVVVLIFIYRGAVWAYHYGYTIFEDAPAAQAPGRDVTITITENMSVKEIGKLLESKGLVKDGTIFYLQNLLSSHKDKLKPGTYELNSSMSAAEMMELMDQKDTAAEDGEDAAGTDGSADTGADTGTDGSTDTGADAAGTDGSTDAGADTAGNGDGNDNQ